MTGSSELGAAVARGFGVVVLFATGALVGAVVALTVGFLRVTAALFRVAVGEGRVFTLAAGALVTRGATVAAGASDGFSVGSGCTTAAAVVGVPGPGSAISRPAIPDTAAAVVTAVAAQTDR
jgi:hypothetical protein